YRVFLLNFLVLSLDGVIFVRVHTAIYVTSLVDLIFISDKCWVNWQIIYCVGNAEIYDKICKFTSLSRKKTIRCQEQMGKCVKIVEKVEKRKYQIGRRINDIQD
ncbi:hypothetical protein V1478_005423, partial [Vespula squamosa]